RRIIGFNSSVLSVEAAFRISELCGVNPVALFEALYVFADCGDRACPVRAKHVWQRGFSSHNLDESTFTLKRIPGADARSVDPNQNLLRFYFGDRYVLYFQGLGTAKI